MLKFAALLLLAGTSAAEAQSGKTIWERYDRLICRASIIQFCTPDGCTKRDARAVYLVDFRGGTIKAAASKTPLIIGRKQEMGIMDYDVVHTDSAQFAFSRKETKPTIGEPELVATKVDAMLPETDTMWMTCNPM